VTTSSDPRSGSDDGGVPFPTISVNAAEQDPDPAATTSDTTAQHKSADYDNDREDLPGGRTGAEATSPAEGAGSHDVSDTGS
jgi:hypothetical protein